MIGLKNKRNSEDSGRIKVIMLLFAVMITGVLFGTLLFCRSNEPSLYMSDALCHGFIKLSCTQTVTEIFTRSLSWTTFLLIMLMFSGFCSISQPAGIIILFWRGAALGVSVSYMYSIYGIKAAAISSLMILPHALSTSVILVYAAREALRLSNLSLLYIIEKCSDEENFSPQVKLYFIRFAVLMLLVVISSAADCALTCFFTEKLLN